MNKDLHNQGPGPDFDEYLHSTEPEFRVPEDLDRQVRRDLQRRLQRRHRRRPNWLLASCVAAIGLLAVVGFEVVVGAGGFTLRDEIETLCLKDFEELREFDECIQRISSESGSDRIMVPSFLEGEDPAIVIPQVQEAHEQIMSGEGRLVEAEGWQFGGDPMFTITTEVDFEERTQEYATGAGWPNEAALAFKYVFFADDHRAGILERIDQGELTCIGEESRVILGYEITFRKYSEFHVGFGDVIFYDGQIEP